MNLNISKTKINPGSEKNFGYVFCILFLILSFYPFENFFINNFFFFTVAVFLFFISNFFPKILKNPNLIWFKFGIILGNIISPIIMVVIYFLIFVPIGLLLKILKKDLLSLSFDRKTKSYWRNKEKNNSSMKNQY